MTDIGSRARRRRPRYAWLAVGPVAAAGAIAIFITTQPAVAATTPSGLGAVGSLSNPGRSATSLALERWATFLAWTGPGSPAPAPAAGTTTTTATGTIAGA